MCQFKKENYLKPLPKAMQDFLIEYTSIDDKEEIAEKAGVSYHTVYKVCLGLGKLTKNNGRAITMLMARAVENCGNIAEKAEQDLQTFKESKDELIA